MVLSNAQWFASPAQPATHSFTANSVLTTVVNPYTFSGVAIGTAAADRKIVVVTDTAGGGGGTAGVSTLTIGGSTATQLVAVSTSDNTTSEIWALNNVSSGTTADIIITWNTTRSRCGIGVWAVYAAADTASDTVSIGNDPDANISTTALAIPANGVAIAGHILNKGAPAATVTWSGLTERYDAAVGNSSDSGASKEVSAAEPAPTITVTISASGNQNCFTAVAFAPG
jgi:hypothetical protein